MYRDQPLHQYLDDLASEQPTPGGGSASALAGTLGAALAAMVARLTLGKAEYAGVQSEIEGLLSQAEQLRARFQQLVQEDIDAYGRLSASFKMPRSTPEEVAARGATIQGRLVEAALVPLEVAESAAELIRCCKRIAEIGNARVLSDVATGAWLATSAANGASWMVRINLAALKDAGRVQALRERLDRAMNEVASGNQQVQEIVGSRV
jgi:formiminotetrahydrofolate cyclodeaminase